MRAAIYWWWGAMYLFFSRRLWFHITVRRKCTNHGKINITHSQTLLHFVKCARTYRVDLRVIDLVHSIIIICIMYMIFSPRARRWARLSSHQSYIEIPRLWAIITLHRTYSDGTRVARRDTHSAIVTAIISICECQTWLLFASLMCTESTPRKIKYVDLSGVSVAAKACNMIWQRVNIENHI